MADYLFYNPDGTIKPIVPDSRRKLKGKSNAAIILFAAVNGKPVLLDPGWVDLNQGDNKISINRKQDANL